jgi:sialate O-acetylesterase
MVVTTDLVDDLDDIHPAYKWIVGQRLAKWALYNDYGKKNISYCGPEFESMKIVNDKIELTFKHADKGLKSKDGKPLNWFMLKGEKNKYERAEAVIIDNKIIVSCNTIKHPQAVRFAWDEIAQPNLTNGYGLPAIPFSISEK